jgi:hypothetical protein
MQHSLTIGSELQEKCQVGRREECNDDPFLDAAGHELPCYFGRTGGLLRQYVFPTEDRNKVTQQEMPFNR